MFVTSAMKMTSIIIALFGSLPLLKGEIPESKDTPKDPFGKARPREEIARVDTEERR